MFKTEFQSIFNKKMSPCLGGEFEFKEKNLVRVLGGSVFRREIGGCNIERQRVLR